MYSPTLYVTSFLQDVFKFFLSFRLFPLLLSFFRFSSSFFFPFFAQNLILIWGGDIQIYKIKVMQDARVWDIERTWSDFKELHTKVCTFFRSKISLMFTCLVKLEQIFPEKVLPPCPSRRFWGVMDSEFVGKRWQDLQHYLVALVSCKDIRDSPPFLHFLTAH